MDSIHKGEQKHFPSDGRKSHLRKRKRTFSSTESSIEIRRRNYLREISKRRRYVNEYPITPSNLGEIHTKRLLAAYLYINVNYFIDLFAII